MADRLPPQFLDLVTDALLRSFWRKRALRTFLGRVDISESFLATWSEDETKRDFVYRMFPILERTERGRRALQEMARALADQTAFPDLDGWEDTKEKKVAAANAVRALKAYLAQQRTTVEEERQRADARRRAQALRDARAKQQHDLDTLRQRLDRLALRLGSAGAGYDFEQWFFDLAGYFEVACRRPYVTEGRQIDGSITLGSTTYLVELKFTQEQTGAPDIGVFYKKVIDKADNTMGIMVSISGYSSVAVDDASGARTPLLLLDHGHLYCLLSGVMALEELVARTRRHASQTGRAYLAAADL